MKIYVLEKTIRARSGETLQVVQTFDSKPRRYTYIIFI